MKKVFYLAVVVFSIVAFSSVQASPLGMVNFEQTDSVVYKAILTDSLPAVATELIEKLYPGATIDEAYKGDNGTFKVVVSSGEKSFVLYFNTEGKLETEE